MISDLKQNMMHSRSKTFLPFIFVAIFLMVSCQRLPDMAEVIQVIDGDTIIIEKGYYVRYIGIDAPEKDTSFYLEAKQANKELVENKKIRLQKDITDKDKYGRLLCYVYVGDTLVNAEIVRRGFAYARAYPPDTKYQVYLEAMEMEARQARRGIWE